MGLLSKLFRCRFNEPKCEGRACICGRTSSPEPPKAPDPTEQAKANLQAQIETLPGAAQTTFDVLSNQDFGLQPTTQLFENVRSEVFPEEQKVREQLLANIFQNLSSPQGISPEQQEAIDLRRGEAQNELVDALRTRANLGGGLFGGRSGRTEERAVRDLQAQFAEEDISRDERNRLNALSSAQLALQILYPQAGIQSPQFINPVASANTQFQGALGARGQDVSLQQQQLASEAALQSALFNALGNAVSGAAQGAGTAIGGCWVAAEVFGGWDEPKTHMARHYILNYAPAWFREFYLEHGQAIAKFISNKPLLKMALRPLFEYLAYKGVTYASTKTSSGW